MEKILFISNHAGFSKFNKAYIDFLSRNGIKVYNASPGIEVMADCTQIDVPINRNPLHFGNISALIILARRIKSENILNVHCHTPSGGLVGRLLKLFIPNLNVIYTAHGFHFYKGAPFLYWLTFFVIELLLSPLTKAIITINNEDYNLSRKLLKRNTYKINGVGVNLDRFKPDEIARKKGREELGIKENSLVLIYVAQFIDRKNHDFLLKAFSEYLRINPNSILLLLGNGPLENRQLQLAEELNIAKYIRFLGYRKNVEYYYQLSDIAISVSKQEGLPMNLVEGLSTGLTIIASDVRGHRDIILQSSGNLLFKLNYKSFLEAILSMNIKTVNNIERKKQNIESAKKFNIHSSLDAMKKIYSKEFKFNFQEQHTKKNNPK